MKNMKIIAICFAPVIFFLIPACDLEWENSDKSFAYHLHGTWISNDPSEYSGSLEISFNRITISGYDRSQTSIPWGNDDLRPFRNFVKGIALKGYSEEQAKTNERISAYIFIEDAGMFQSGIPYIYWYINNPQPGIRRIHFLRLVFSSREETLQKID